MLLPPSAARAQSFTYRGFIETRVWVYPQTPAIERPETNRALAEGRARFEPGYRPAPWLSLSASFDARIDTAEQVERDWSIDWRDRGSERPAFSIRQLSAAFRHGRLIVEAGKQFIRWGKTDILNPTDRFAPRDFLEVTDNEFLGVTGVRVQYEAGAGSVDAAWVPQFTPSRIPRFGSRWTPLPEDIEILPVIKDERHHPKGSQLGVRWNHLGAGYEVSASLYRGFNHLPSIQGQVRQFPAAIELRRLHPDLRMVGLDAALPLPWVTLKGEVAYLTTESPTSDDVSLYVIQVERQSGELSLVAGYAGEVVTAERAAIEFAPDRGLTRSFLGRLGYTIDTNRSISLEAAARQTGDGLWAKIEYTQASGAHLRLTGSATVIRGTSTDFLGQYRRNSHGVMTVRYSF